MKLFAGVPYTFPVVTPKTGHAYYATIEFQLFKLEYLGVDGYFDRYPIHSFKWLTGPKKGQADRSYSVMFWRLPSKVEKRQMWGELTSYEQEKLQRGGYPELRAANYCAS